MANDFYNPGTLTQAGGHAASLVADAGGAWGQAFQQLGQWAEAEKMQGQQIAAREKEQRLEIDAAKDRQTQTLDFEKGRLAFAAAIEQGMAPDEALPRYFSLAKVGQAASDRRDAARDGVLATGIFNSPVKSLGGQETGHLASQVAELQQQAIAAADEGDLTGAQSRWSKAKSLLDNSEFRSNLFMASRSMFPLEREQSAALFDKTTSARFAAALERGKGQSSAAVIKQGGDSWSGSLMQTFNTKPADLPPEMQKLALFMHQAAQLPPEKGGGSDWNAGAQYGHALLDTFNELKSSMPERDKKDPEKLSRLMVASDALLAPVKVLADANHMPVGKATALVRDAATKMLSGVTTVEGKESAYGAVVDVIKSGAQWGGGRGVAFVPRFLGAMKGVTAEQLAHDGGSAFGQFAANASSLETGERLRLRNPDGSPISAKGLDEELVAGAFDLGSPLSPRAQTGLQTMQQFQLEQSRMQSVARGQPSAPGGPRPSQLDSVLAKSHLRVLEATYRVSPNDTSARDKALRIAAIELVPQLNEYSKRMGVEDKFDEDSAYRLLASSYDPEGRATLVKNPEAVLLNPYGSHKAAVEDANRVEEGVVKNKKTLTDLLGVAGYEKHLADVRAAAEDVRKLGTRDDDTMGAGTMSEDQKIARDKFIADKYGEVGTPKYRAVSKDLSEKRQAMVNDALSSLGGIPGMPFDPGSVIDSQGRFKPLTSVRRELLVSRLNRSQMSTWLGEDQVADLVSEASRTNMEAKAFAAEINRRLARTMRPENVDPATVFYKPTTVTPGSPDPVAVLNKLASFDVTVDSGKRNAALVAFRASKATTSKQDLSQNSLLSQHPLLQKMKDTEAIRRPSMDEMLDTTYRQLTATSDPEARKQLISDLTEGLKVAGYYSKEAMDRVNTMYRSVGVQLERTRIEVERGKAKTLEIENAGVPSRKADLNPPGAEPPVGSP